MKIKILLAIIFIGMSFIVYDINNSNKMYYENLLKLNMEKTTLGMQPKRGRILDINNKVLIDNEEVYNIGYHKSLYISIEEEISIASVLSKYVKNYNLSDVELKHYYLDTNDNGINLISTKEWDLYDKRKLNEDDIYKMKMIRITPQLLNYSEEEKKIIYVYTLMNKGYNYDDKIILHDLTIDEVKEILDLNIPNIKEIITYKRVYPYEETIKSILGYIGNITKETKDYYLNKGYSLDDYVGVSGLEEQYESLLKGKKAKYFINSDNTLSKIEDEVLGNDLILNIDIDKVLFLEQTLKDELLLARTYKSATYFNHTYALISDPNNGAIIAIVGIKLNDDNTFSDISINAFTESYAMGSIVKGASMSVGYLNDAIDIGKMVKDSCVKLSNETPKCSYKYLGYVDDITALKTSSNYYQFITAIKVTGNNYIYNMKFMPTFKDFELYREIFRKYGLGAKSNIDFPIEYTGIKGEKVAGDLLLNLSIGQYDTYTPISLISYINTIANYGNRYALRFKKEDYKLFVDQVPLESKYYDRITEGLYEVFHGGTASYYVKDSLNAVGKTGTSETFIDTDNNGIIDKSIINNSLVFYYPKEKPKYSIAILAPYITTSDTNYPFTAKVSRKITDYLE